MRYEKLERIVLLVGAAAILGSLALSLAAGRPGTSEIVAQLLLLATLIISVHYGRRGGFIAGVAATAIYLTFWIPGLKSGVVTTSALVVLVSRVIAFALVGVVAGEMFSQLKYTLAKVKGTSAVDDWSRVYNQAYAHHTLTQAKGKFTRYGEPFSVLEIALSPSLFAGLRPARQRSLVRGVADHIRADVRMVDEVARLDDGRFLVLLPHTPADGGQVVIERIASGVRNTLGSTDEAVKVRCLSLPQAEPEFDALVAEIAPAADDQDDVSGA